MTDARVASSITRRCPPAATTRVRVRVSEPVVGTEARVSLRAVGATINAATVVELLAFSAGFPVAFSAAQKLDGAVSTAREQTLTATIPDGVDELEVVASTHTGDDLSVSLVVQRPR